MIRINLLGTPKSKNKRSAASTVAAMDMGDVGSPAMKVAVAAALLVVFNLGYWYKLDREKQSIAAKMVVAEQKNHELAGVKARYLERQKQAENYQRSVDIKGMALSADAVANLISNLQKTGYFKNIEIKETFQDETFRDMQAFQFTLSCEKTKS